MNSSFVSLPFLLMGLCSCNTANESPANSPGNEHRTQSDDKPTVSRIYTTAEDTGERLTEGSTLAFQPATQPLETEIAVFVNPGKDLSVLPRALAAPSPTPLRQSVFSMLTVMTSSRSCSTLTFSEDRNQLQHHPDQHSQQ